MTTDYDRQLWKMTVSKSETTKLTLSDMYSWLDLWEQDCLERELPETSVHTDVHRAKMFLQWVEEQVEAGVQPW